MSTVVGIERIHPPVERISLAELHERFAAQRVSHRDHFAVVCPMCKTVQSIACLRAAGATDDVIERSTGFACVGRFTGAGPYRRGKSKEGVGCDWFLGGLFAIHKLEVETPDGNVHYMFQIATSEQAQALERAHEARATKELGS